MTFVNTVLGPVSSADLGFTLMHDHIIASVNGHPGDYAEVFGSGFMERIVAGLRRAKDGGIDTVVDATTVDLGRDVAILTEASKLSGVNLIAVTGWWLNIPSRLARLGVDELTELFTREVQEGIDDTNVKAGILKAASDASGVTGAEETVLRAVARAHVQTNAPIMIHSYSPGEVGRQQLAILREEGVNLCRVKVDHSNDTSDVGYLTYLLEQGCYLGLDRYPDGRLTDRRWQAHVWARTRTMKALIEAGFAERLLPSHDWTAAWLNTDPDEEAGEQRTAGDACGFLFLKTVVFDQLREMGVTEETLKKLCIENPRRFFEGE